MKKHSKIFKKVFVIGFSTIFILVPIVLVVFLLITFNFNKILQPKGYNKFNGNFNDKNFSVSFIFNTNNYNTQTKVNNNTYLFGQYLSGSTYTIYKAVVTNPINKNNVNFALKDCLFNNKCSDYVNKNKKEFTLQGNRAISYCTSFKPKGFEKQLINSSNNDFCVLYITDKLLIVGSEKYGNDLIKSVTNTVTFK